ncbi:Myb-like DNA-binding protein myb-like protein [Hapsidospora chrysogenum ATCC 11550]|uniref:Myb-like DNA-binding protein myb-like protein n=1 Tax=Hapsidospora chrysogenum (strain ATCC 11550 / CBS 779.69 / DSM 880 / IAM 14645 / JCM 23072 / IMI 49137) TaxID=857340 RepID=A0A086T1N6_HAPC1|nr:Myb-like DNA-binding protein myb-like protein [Hapsidospora chrysogenum ATCC 11550]
MAPRNRGPWSAEEDARLLELVLPLEYDWVKIEKRMGTRNAKQCRERYQQQLKPELNHDPITPAEGQFILDYVSSHGKQWANLSRKLPGRSDNCIKNWWNGQQNRRRKQRREGSNGYSDDQFRPDTPHSHSHQASAPPMVPRTLSSDLYLTGYHYNVHGQAGHDTGIDSPLSSPGSARTAESDGAPNYTTTPRGPLLLPWSDPFQFTMPRQWAPSSRSRQQHGVGAVSPRSESSGQTLSSPSPILHSEGRVPDSRAIITMFTPTTTHNNNNNNNNNNSSSSCCIINHYRWRNDTRNRSNAIRDKRVTSLVDGETVDLTSRLCCGR